jgi:two-component system chemotaxis response regulator CheB
MSNFNIVVIGVSTGGPMALKEIFSALPSVNAAFIVVLHIRAGMDRMILRGLSAVSSMPVSMAEDGEFIRPGHVYLAPGGYHLKLEGNRRIILVEGERVNHVQPSADVTMLSLVKPRTERVIGVVLTGMGRDGAEGIRHIKSIGGTTIAQDRQSSAIFGMPMVAAQTGAVDHVCAKEKIARKLRELLR